MQSLWGCAYEMRSLGDVNYKITPSAFSSSVNHFFELSV
jgi:hypothetical protein